MIVANGIDPAVNGITTQVGHVDFGGVPAHQGLQLALIEHGEPRRGDDGAETTEERRRLELRLNLEPIARDIRDVHQPVLVGHGNLGPSRAKVACDGGWFGTIFALARDGVGDGKIQRKVLDITRIILELKLDEWLVDRFQRRKGSPHTRP